MSGEKVFGSVKETCEYISTKFSNFLSDNKDKKFAILYDNDPDGICSGVLMQKFLKSQGVDVADSFVFSDVKLFSKELSERFKENEIGGLITVDFNIAGFGYLDSFKEFVAENEIAVAVFDHHYDESDYGIEYYFNGAMLQTEVSGAQYCTAKIVYDVICEIEPRMKKYGWIESIGIIGDFNQKTWGEDIRQVVKLDNMAFAHMEDFEDIIMPEDIEDYYLTPYGKSANMMFFGIAKDGGSDISKIYSYLLESDNVLKFLEKLSEYNVVREEVYDYLENYEYFMKYSPATKTELNVFEVEVKSNNYIEGILSNLISRKDANTIFMVYNEYKDGYVHVSLRLQNDSVNLGKVTKEVCSGIAGANGGGHGPAAGARIHKDNFKEFKNKFFGILAKIDVEEGN